jgi:hypothetical protein
VNSNDNIFISSSVVIDTDFDGVEDTFVVADENGTNFSVRDYTFTRKYSVVAKPNHASAATLDIDLEQNRTSEVYTDIFTPSTSQIADVISDLTKVTGEPTDYDLKAYDDDNDTLYVISEKQKFKNFAINQSDGNETILKLVDATGDSNASGIIGSVYTLADLGRATIDTKQKFDINISCMANQKSNAPTDEGSLAFTMFNFVKNYGDRYANTINDTNITVRFGLWDERNTSSKIRTYADSYQSIGGVIVGTDYNPNATPSDVNFSVSAEDLNTSCANGTTGELLAGAMNKFFSDTNESFNVTASYINGIATGNTPITKASSLVLYGDINISKLDTNSYKSEAAAFSFGNTGITIIDTENNETIRIFESNLSIPTNIPNLTFEKVYAARMNTDIDNPLSVLQRKVDADGNNYKITKILTTNEHNSSISWSFLDMTKYSSGWFDDNDPYNIFSFNGEKGYWVFLDGGHSNPLDGIDAGDITSSIFKYTHEFTGDANSTASSPNDETINWKNGSTMTTVNTMYDGSVTVDVGDMVDASKVDRAILEIAGEKIPMTKSGNEYSASFSEYDLGDFGNDSTLDVNVSFFTTDFYSKTIGMVIDNEAPTRPTIAINDPYLTDVTFTSSTDTLYFHLFEGDINDSKPLSHITAFDTEGVDQAVNTMVDSNITADGTTGIVTGYNFCASVRDFNDNLGDYQFVAVDGALNSGYTVGGEYYGDIYYNRASNVGYIPDSNNSYPIYKNASIYQIAADGADRIPVLYGSDCKTESMTQLENDDYGFSATSLNSAEFNISIETDSSVPALAETGVKSFATVKIAVGEETNEIAKVQFNKNYYSDHDQPFLIAYNGAIYKTDFAILLYDSTAGNNTDMDTVLLEDSNKTNLTGQAILGSD